MAQIHIPEINDRISLASAVHPFRLGASFLSVVKNAIRTEVV